MLVEGLQENERGNVGGGCGCSLLLSVVHVHQMTGCGPTVYSSRLLQEYYKRNQGYLRSSPH